MGREKELKKLLKKYSIGTCTTGERRLLEKWFTAMGVGQPAQELEDADKERILRDIYMSPRLTQKPVSKILWPWKIAAAAACLAGLLLISLYVLKVPNNDNNIQYLSYQTGVGEIKRIRLPDSSLIWLNAKSHIQYRKDFEKHREIRLRGEAFFDVRPDKDHPFTVSASDSLQTTVLGTSFNINSYENSPESKITVLSGRVQVEQKDIAGKMGILSANESIIYHHKIRSYEKKNVNAGRLTAWRTGSWKLQINNIADLTLIMENHFGIEVIINKENTSSTEVDMNFSNKQKPGEIIKVFSLLTDCSYKWVDETTVELY